MKQQQPLKQNRKNIVIKIKEEYERQKKPVVYEYKKKANTQPQRVFSIIVSTFKDLIQHGMKQSYLVGDDGESIPYWQQFVKQFTGTYEMDYVEKLYDDSKGKLKEYLVLMIANKQIFNLLTFVKQNMGFMYEKTEDQYYEEILSSVTFLSDNQYQVNAELVTDFGEYCEKRREEELIQKKKKEQEQRRKQQIEAQKERARLQQQNLKLQQLKRKQIEQENRRAQQELMKAKQKANTASNQARLQQSWMPSSIHLEDSRRTGKESPERTQFQNTTTRGHLKKSQQLYEGTYRQIEKSYQFQDQPVESKDKSNCFECGGALSMGLYIVGCNMNYCNYTGQWYCNNCISSQRMPIPWKAIQSFDLRGYSVCEKSKIQIKTLYSKPIIRINNQASIVAHNKKLFDFLLLKRQIHLMYDSICNTSFIQSLLGHERLHYCLQINLFSLKNLYDIYNSLQEVQLSKNLDALRAHFYSCPQCQKKGFKCKSCNKPTKIFPFELKQTKGCLQCRKLYHRECFVIKGCLCSHN